MMRSSARGGLRVGAFALLLWLPTGGSPVQAATQLSCRSSARFDPAGPAGGGGGPGGPPPPDAVRRRYW
jgi:hypothetical protein